MRGSTIAAVAGALCVAGLACAQARNEAAPRARPPVEPPPAGFWPTSRMLELYIDRLSDDYLANLYGFDEDQIYNTRELLKRRLPKWLNENRAEIMQLTNEYVEALLDEGPPDAQTVAHWARRVLPLIDSFTDQAEEISEEMRTYMTEDQQLLLDGQLAAFRVGVNFATQRLGTWSEGGFNPETDWFRNPGWEQRQQQREQRMQEEMELAKRQAMGENAPVPGAAPPMEGPRPREPRRPTTTSAPVQDDWTRYVEDFIRRFQLNNEQQEQARKLLKSAHEQRDRYLRRADIRARLAEAEQKQRAASTDDERAEVEKLRTQLSRPLERMFQVLKERLEPIPTRAQRQAALEREAAAKPKSSATATSSQPADWGAKRESPGSP